MGLVKRRVSTKAKVNVCNNTYVSVANSVIHFRLILKLKKTFLQDINNIIEMDEIPLQLVINFGQTGINYIPTSSWTMEKQGSKRVEIIGKDDEHQITAVLAGTMAGDFIPIQLIYQGTTSRCLPSYKFPQDWDIIYSPKHRSNENTMASYLQKVIFPYIQKKQHELNLLADYPSLLLFDNFNGQCTETLLKMIDDKNINTVIILANCTDRL